MVGGHCVWDVIKWCDIGFYVKQTNPHESLTHSCKNDLVPNFWTDSKSKKKKRSVTT